MKKKYNSYYPIVIWEKRTKFRSSMNKIISDLFMAEFSWIFFLVRVGL
jgi:hypothetical protein